jgi:hypothetical protein
LSFFFNILSFIFPTKPFRYDVIFIIISYIIQYFKNLKIAKNNNLIYLSYNIIQNKLLQKNKYILYYKMNLIKNIPLYKKELIDNEGKKYSIKKDLNIESSINKILDSQTCNYYIIIDVATWILAFNVDKSQHKEKLESMFEIRLFNDDKKNRYVINITKEAYKFEEWNDVISKLEKEIKKYYL